MAEALKHVYSPAYLQRLAQAMTAQHKAFDGQAFTAWVFAGDWDQLELKDRMRKICIGLHQYLALPYATALEVLMPVASQFGGGELGDYASMFFPEYVERYGLNDFDTSMPALAYFTQYSSAEFAVRPFIVKYGSQMMAQMQTWASSDNYYIRRLASEGCRPRLPWAMALPVFKADPSPILPILEQLKDDEHLFVRRSVANNLNDIAKDNPDITVATAKRWLGSNENINWLVKHACRSLLKQGHNELMPLFGFAPPTGIKIKTLELTTSLSLGGTLHFSFTLHSNKPLGRLRLEYGVDFMKSNGKQSRKIFQISESEVASSSKTFSKRHSFKPISTRRYYSGSHGLAIIVNGCELDYRSFLLEATQN